MSPPEDLSGSTDPSWIGVELEPNRPGDFVSLRPGVMLLWTEAGGLQLSPSQVDLPNSLRAEHPRDATWLLLTYQRDVTGLWTYGGRPVDAERIEARLVTAAGALLARGTAQSIPPRNVDLVPDRVALPERTPADLVERMLRELAQPTPAIVAASSRPPRCILDRMPRSWPERRAAHVACSFGATAECTADCRAGNGRSCALAGYSLEHSDVARSRELYGVGCGHGDINACTNWALAVRADYPEAELQQCATEIFRRTCDADDPFGCGMLGAALAAGEGAERLAGQDLLEETCERRGGFPCYVLGGLRQRGELGEAARLVAADAFRRGCATVQAQGTTWGLNFQPQGTT